MIDPFCTSLVILGTPKELVSKMFQIVDFASLTKWATCLSSMTTWLSYAIQGANMNVDIGGLFEFDPLTLVSKTKDKYTQKKLWIQNQHLCMYHNHTFEGLKYMTMVRVLDFGYTYFRPPCTIIKDMVHIQRSSKTFLNVVDGDYRIIHHL